MSQVQVGDTLKDWRETAAYWAKHHETIRTMFMPLTRALIEEANIVPGQSVLDVAGGAGEPSITIAETVGPAGVVMCTDAVSEMVAAAEREAQRREMKNMEFRQCTADSLPFADDFFDVAVSRLGVMFFPNPLEGLREMLRVIKPGGRIALAVWARSELNPYSYVVTQTLSRHVQPSEPDPNAPDAFRFAEPGKLAAILKEAGATEVSERLVKFDIAAPISAAEFWDFRSEISEAVRKKLKNMSAEERQQIANEIQEAVSEFFPGGHMKFPAQLIIVSGTKWSS